MRQRLLHPFLSKALSRARRVAQRDSTRTGEVRGDGNDRAGLLLLRERRWGWAGRRGLLVSEGGPALAGRAVREPPLRCVGGGEVRVSEGEVPACAGTTMGARVGDGGRGRRPRPAPLPWVPAFAGTTRAGGPSTGSGRTESRGEAGRVTRAGCAGRTYVLLLMVFSLRTGVRRSGVWITGQGLCSWNARSLCWPLGLTASIFCGSCGGCGSSRGAG